MPEPRDQMPAALCRGHLRACHADREQVIGVLKAAFVHGRLGKDELTVRVGQALAARTYADLATLTADLPAGLVAAEPSYQPARARAPLPVRTRSEEHTSELQSRENLVCRLLLEKKKQ